MVELNRGSYKSPKELCRLLGLHDDWLHTQVRYIKSKMDDMPLDMLVGFMKNYMMFYNQDVDDSESLNALSRQFVEFVQESNTDLDLHKIQDWPDFEGAIQASDFDTLKELAFEVTNTDTIAIDKKKGGVKSTVQDFIEAHRMNGAEAISSTIWESGDQFKVAVKFDHKSRNEIDFSKMVEATDAFIKRMGDFAPKFPIASHKSLGDNVGVICIHDAHFGKLCLPSVSGDEYNLEIAEARWKDAVQYHLETFKKNKVGRAVLVVGNDLLNTDNGKTTTAGTPQDEATLYEHTFAFVERVVIESALYIANEMPVEIVTVAGNHDKMSVFYLARVLQAYFKNHDMVSVNTDGMENMLRRYVVFGNTALCFTHGDKEKRKDILSIVEMELEELYPDIRFKRIEIIVGHFHQEKGKDDLESFKNATFRVMPSISGTDRWHKEMGYIGRKASASLIYGDRFVHYIKHDVDKRKK